MPFRKNRQKVEFQSVLVYFTLLEFSQIAYIVDPPVAEYILKL